MKYEMVELSNTLDDILDKISCLQKPIGIMLFGVDSNLKELIFHKIIQNSKMLFGEQMYSRGRSYLEESGIERVVATKEKEETNKKEIVGIVTKLSGDASIRYGGRHRVVMGMHNDGMQSIVGIYVKIEPRSSELREQQTVLEKHPPTADGLTALVTVTTSQ